MVGEGSTRTWTCQAVMVLWWWGPFCRFATEKGLDLPEMLLKKIADKFWSISEEWGKWIGGRCPPITESQISGEVFVWWDGCLVADI